MKADKIVVFVLDYIEKKQFVEADVLQLLTNHASTIVSAEDTTAWLKSVKSRMPTSTYKAMRKAYATSLKKDCGFENVSQSDMDTLILKFLVYAD